LISVSWPVENVLAFSTTRLSPSVNSSKTSSLSLQTTNQEKNYFSEFNLGEHVGDVPDIVTSNRNVLQSILPTNIKIQWLEQVHENQVVVVDGVSLKPKRADASITRCKLVALAIMTADCLPILLTSKSGDEIAAVHAGWRPLSAGIIANTLAEMATSSKDLHAWLGPCIGPENFEVGNEVKKKFVDISPNLASFFTPNANGKFQADLAGIAIFLLKQSGIESIVHHQECTHALKDRFYSFRRENKTGRMASIIYFGA
jgi:YfiH family protein